jgi:HD-GYP domain-containing protein (c-di-GMP phosphodiesterase class II)
MGRLKGFEKAVNLNINSLNSQRLDFDQFIFRGFEEGYFMFLKAEDILSNINGISLEELQHPENYLNEGDAHNIISIINALQNHDRELFYHCFRVGVFAAVIGNIMFPECVGILFIGGLLHDIGKAFIPNHILYKKERLTEADFDVIKNHTIIGNSFLIRSGVTNKDILDIAKYHHRRYDGTGYPEIDAEYTVSQLTDIISVADAFDAMINKRVYSTTKTVDEAIAELVRCSGKQFNPHVVETFKRYAGNFRTLAARG